MLTAQAKEDFKQFIERIISYAVVTVNGKAEKKVIQKVQLYNTAGKLWAEKAENISLSNVQEGALYRFVFDFVEKEV